ncbi:MAG: MATE family efflux transporter [Proteobacteria bacterium]|nr:MATE family efflux transporter [Pseudomonadota bacterium]
MIKYREISGLIFLKKLLKELKQLLKIGIPIYGSQISYMGMGVTDTIVAGRASALDLSGLAIGNALSMPFYFLLGGCLFAVTPIVAQLFGAKKFEEIGQKVREILWVSIALGFIGFVLYRNLSFLIPYFDIEENIAQISDGYLKAMSFGFIANMLFTCLRCYSEGMGLTLPVFWVAFIGMLLNIPLDIIFVYGYFGVPSMGGVGCGIATSINIIIGLFVLILVILKKKEYKPTRLFSKFSGPNKDTTKEALKLGVPIGFGVFVELSMFSGAALILGSLGATVISAHTVAINIASVLFILPLSFGHASHIAILICLVGAILNTLIILSFKEALVSMYSEDLTVIAIAINLLLFAAIFQIPDGMQMGALGSLRGYKDTFAPMLMLIFTYWLIALPAGYYLTYYGFFGDPLGAAGIWIGMITGLTAFAALIIPRLNYVANKLITKSSSTLP